MSLTLIADRLERDLARRVKDASSAIDCLCSELREITQMLWDFNQDLAQKLLHLALCPAAPVGEWQAAALAYFRGLRAAEVTADELREMLAIGQEPPEPPSDLTPVVSFGRYRDRTVRWVVEQDAVYAEWLLCKATNLSAALRSELRRELWQRYGTQSGESSRSRP